MSEKEYCMSSYLMYRYVFEKNKRFHNNLQVNLIDLAFERKPIKSAKELLVTLSEIVKEATIDMQGALALSGGIDSAILARFMPRGSKAYTFRCVVPGKEVTDESRQAAVWARANSLEHEIVEIRWEDMEAATDKLMLHKGAPIHSIEAQIYLAAVKAKREGAARFIFGENADIIYGGMDGLLARDWLYWEFVERYTYVMPYKVLKNPQMILEPYKEFEINGHIDGHDFINKYFRQEALGTYHNACETAGIKFCGPYSMTYLDSPIDYEKIRSGNTKYLIREAFKILYPQEEIPAKIPMPRPMDEWLGNWIGPTRKEFVPHCTDHMTGDQKWMVWALERFLNLIDRM